jgi:hypothetical protein
VAVKVISAGAPRHHPLLCVSVPVTHQGSRIRAERGGWRMRCHDDERVGAGSRAGEAPATGYPREPNLHLLEQNGLNLFTFPGYKDHAPIGAVLTPVTSLAPAAAAAAVRTLAPVPQYPREPNLHLFGQNSITFYDFNGYNEAPGAVQSAEQVFVGAAEAAKAKAVAGAADA